MDYVIISSLLKPRCMTLYSRKTMIKNNGFREGVGSLSLAGGIVKRYSHLEKGLAIPPKVKH